MSTLVMKHFDLLDFVNKSMELGVSKPLAEYQARKLEEVIEIAAVSHQETLESKNLATQKDLKELEYVLKKDIKEVDLKIKELEVKMEQMRNHTIMWMTSLFIASGFIAHFLK